MICCVLKSCPVELSWVCSSGGAASTVTVSVTAPVWSVTFALERWPSVITILACVTVENPGAVAVTE